MPNVSRMLATLGVAGAMAAAITGPAHAHETLSLDTREAANDGYAGPVYTQADLVDDVAYVVDVQGTFSPWAAGRWDTGPACGTPEAAPMFSSPSAPFNVRVGVDAEFVFGGAAGGYACRHTAPLPVKNTAIDNSARFELSAGGLFVDPTPVGDPAVPDAAHRYKYVVTGSDVAAGFGFRVGDGATHDNYGVLNLRVRPALPIDCKDGGWRSFPGARNQGDCVSDVARGITRIALRLLQKKACEAFARKHPSAPQPRMCNDVIAD